MAALFPFSAIVAQDEMKLALLIAAVDSTVGGVLVFGDRGTGKSTAVRALAALLPPMTVVKGCRYHCDPDGGTRCTHLTDASAAFETEITAVPVVDLPLGATEDRVVGALDLERALTQGEKAFEPGLLARAHRGFLYIDEVNLLEDHLVDVLLDVAASGENVVEREGLSVRHPARFVLVGSGNPEEGELRPQLLDRFGLSVEVKTPTDLATRIDVVRRRDQFERDPASFIQHYKSQDAHIRAKLEAARRLLPTVKTSDHILETCARLCMALGTDGLRGELTLLRAARALAAFDSEHDVTDGHVQRVAPLALRHRLRRNPLDDAGSTVRVERALREIFAPRGMTTAASASPGTVAHCEAAASAWSTAIDAAVLIAIAPHALGGVLVRARAGPVRDRWFAIFKGLLAADTPMRRVPLNVPDERLLGGLDLAATLKAGKPISERGLLSEAHLGVVILPSAERLEGGTVARISSAMDRRRIAVARDGFEFDEAAEFSVIAVDESASDHEQTSPALIDRLAFIVDLNAISLRDAIPPDDMADRVASARSRLASATFSDEILDALCSAAMAMGIASLRAPSLALIAARALAVLDSRATVNEADASRAAQLVLAPRATQLPPDTPIDDDAAPAEPPPPQDNQSTNDEADLGDHQQLADVVLDAATAAIPAGLLAALQLERARRLRGKAAGRAGAPLKAVRKGRPIGVRRGELKSGARMNVVETLRAAAPWQPLRRRESGLLSAGISDRSAEGVDRAHNTPFALPLQKRVHIRKDDFRLTRFKHHAETTTIFVVDASGSSALNRLAEAKGAVELLLADCYVRRDSVALVAFRGKIAEILLPPTRSLARAKRCLAGLPGGGGTPLAQGLDAAFALADAARRKGQTPTVIVLTDGRANIARDGTPGRPKAEADGLEAARLLAHSGVASLVIDTSPQPATQSAQLADAMGAVYLPLPRADATTLKSAIQATTRELRASNERPS